MRGDRHGDSAAAPAAFCARGPLDGGYIVYEIIRQAAERVAQVALLDTGAQRPMRRNGAKGGYVSSRSPSR